MNIHIKNMLSMIKAKQPNEPNIDEDVISNRPTKEQDITSDKIDGNNAEITTSK
jgi:hypothetical protein